MRCFAATLGQMSLLGCGSCAPPLQVSLKAQYIAATGSSYKPWLLLRWRAVLLLPVLRFWGQVLLWLGFFMVPRVKGREHIKEAERLRALLVFNHVSYLDALLICSLFSPSGLAKVRSTDTSPVSMLLASLLGSSMGSKWHKQSLLVDRNRPLLLSS